MSKGSASNQIPAIRPSQFESSSIGALKNSVNTFRGDVNFQKALVTLPGKPNDSALQVQATVMCESNVNQDVTTWNLEAPTGVMGLGWGLVGSQISAKSTGAVSAASVQYEYQSGGSGNALIPGDVPWVRAYLADSISSEMGGPAVSTQLIQAFAAAGLRLSSAATIQETSPGTWEVDDPVHEHLYTITTTTLGTKQVLEVTDGGDGFDLQDYQFYKIFYYAKYERWEITDNNGIVSVYGGGYAPPKLGVTGDGFNRSAGNSVEWSVKWGGANGNWTGSSIQTGEQYQYATAWNLSAQIDRYGDRVIYEYNNFGRTDGLLNRGAEQLVGGPGGLPYTKACYLTRIVDVFGGMIDFSYIDKTYTATAQEYMDPHKVLTPANENNTPPSNLTTPDAYQDRYETLLLSEVAVKSSAGELIYSLAFTYSPPINVTQTPAGVNVVVNGSPASGSNELTVSVNLGDSSATVTYNTTAGDSALQAAEGLWAVCADSRQLTSFINVGELIETPGGAGAYQFLLYARSLDATLETNQVTVSPASAGQVFLTTSASAASDSGESAQQAAGLVKSYLLGITEYTAAGDSLPGYSFDYFWPAQGPNFGAIKSIRYPDGGCGRFTFAAAELSICNREQTVEPPKQLGANAVPHVWFGENYAVTVWTSQSGGEATLEVHNWTGRWQRWSPKDPIIYSGAGGFIIPGSLQLIASLESFAVWFTAGTSTYLYLYNRSPHKNAAWEELDNDGNNFVDFTQTYEVSVAAGNRFVIVTTQKISGNETEYSLYRYTYDWQSGGWTGIETPVINPTTSPVFVLAHDEYYLCLVYEGAGQTSTIQLSYLDPLGNWNEGGSLPLNEFNLGDNDNMMVWAAGSSMAAYTLALTAPAISGGPPPSGNYLINIVTWDAGYQSLSLFTSNKLEPLGVPQMPPQNWPPQPLVIGNDTVASGPNVWRFTGDTDYGNNGWVMASFPAVTDATTRWIAFAYGEDFTIQVVNTTSQISTTRLIYDANTTGFTGPTPITYEINNPPVAAGYPYASSDDYFTAAGQVFYRGASTSWDTQTVIFGFQSTVNTLSLINQAPSFIADAMSTSEVQMLVLQNGGMRDQAPTTLSNVAYFSMYNSDGQPAQDPEGQYPAGMNAFVTYPSDTPDGEFQNAGKFTLYRFAGENISGPITDYYVKLLDIFDGYEQHLYTCYEFNPATAACDPSGQVVEYYQSTVYDGCATPMKSEFGRTVNLYLNDAMAGGYSMLNGQQLQTATFAGAALFETSYSSDLELDASKPNQPPVSAPAALSALFTDNGVVLSPDSTLQLIRIDVPAAEGLDCVAGYYFWIVEDPSTGDSYNLDFNGDPTSDSAIRAFRGRLVSSSTNGWELFTSRNGNPQTPEEIKLHGGYARITSVATTEDGVALTNTYGYTGNGLDWPYTGATQTQSWSFPNVDGNVENYTQTTTYGAMALSVENSSPAYPQLAAGNVLTPVAQLLTRVQVGEGPWITTASSATTCSPWEARDDVEVMDTQSQYTWVGDPTGSDIGMFPFGGTPSDSLWRLISQTQIRGKHGTVLESIDEAKTTHSTVYDLAGQAQVLIVSNASYSGDEVDFCGFEAEEGFIGGKSSPRWTLTGGAAIQSGNAHTGAQSLYLPAGATAQHDALTPARNDRVYLFSCWYQVAGTTAAAGAGVQIKITQGGAQVGDTITAAFTADPGQWAYTLVPVDLSAYQEKATGAGPLSIEISTEMGSAEGLWIDDVHFSPRICTYAAQIHDTLTKLPVARLGITDQTRLMLYDRFYRLIGMTGPDGQAQGLRLSYYSLQGNPSGFNPADPNATLRIKAQYGGTVQTFQDGDDWQRDWTADNAAAWAASNGTLVHTSTAESNSLTAPSAVTENYALQLELVAAEGVNQPFTLGDGFEIAIGSAATFSWKGQWTLSIADGAQNQQSFGPVQNSPGSILVMLTGGYLLFFQDGQLLFSQSPAITGTPQIITGQNALAIRNLVLLEGPATHLTQQDATGKRRQEQVFCGADYFVNQAIQNAAGDLVVKTKTVPATFGEGSSQPAMQYRSSLVDVAAFQANLNGSGLMTGDVSDYYNGSDVASGRTDDGGYPYSRRRYEASPLKRMVEIGMPGQAYAIINPYTTPASSRNTTKCGYGSNAAVTFDKLNIPAGQYQLTTNTNQVGLAQVTVKDQKGNTVATVVPNGSSPMITTNRVTYGLVGGLTQTQLPNYFQAIDGASSQSQIKQCNPLGQLLYETMPDSGTIQYMYDAAGWLRFFQDAQAAGDGYLVYLLYDEMGRKVARGTAVFDWTDSTAPALQGYANSRGWPEVGGDGVSFTRGQTLLYDGDGSQPEQVGNQVGAITYNRDVAVVFEEMTWYKRGMIKSRTTTTRWADDTVDGPFKTVYDYDNLGNTTSVEYPTVEGVDFSTIKYQYNGLSKITQISDQDNNLIASFQYDASGNPVIATLGTQPVEGALTYNSPGRLISASGTTASSDFNSNLTWNFDGTVNTQNDALQSGNDSNDFDLTYGYDEFACLSSASANTQSLTQGFGYETPAEVQDLNGNVWTITGANAAGFDYTAGTNQIYQATWEKGATTTFDYLLNGSLRSRKSSPSAPSGLPDLSLTYTEGSTQTASIDVGSDTTIEYVYDSSGNRVGKRVTEQGAVTSSVASVQGPLRPIVQVDQAGAATAFIYGPNGLVAMSRDDTRYAVAVDHLGSTRMVFNPDGSAAAAYSFLAYGEFALRQEPSAGWMPLLFTGQEFDGETGLYNFNARLYDPSVCRFCAVDSAQQYPSPYVYAGNHPTVLTDPTGNINQWEQAGIALGMIALVGIGTVIGLAPMALELEGAALVLAYATFGAIGGAVSGAGTSGLTYDASHNPNDWSTTSFLWSMGIGALGGAISGAISGDIVGYGTTQMDKAGVKAVTEAADSEVVSDVSGGVVSDATSASSQAAGSAASSTKTASQIAGENFKKLIPYRIGGNAAGYFVSGLVTTPLTNYLVYNNSNIWSGIGLALVEDVFEGAGMALLSGGLSYAWNGWELSLSLTKFFVSSSDAMLWSAIGGSAALLFGATGAAYIGFIPVNTVWSNWDSKS